MDDEKGLTVEELRRAGLARPPFRRLGGTGLLCWEFRPRLRGIPTTAAVALVLLFAGATVPRWVRTKSYTLPTGIRQGASDAVNTLAATLADRFSDPLEHIIFPGLLRPWHGAPWLASVLLTLAAGVHLLRGRRSPGVGALALIAAAVSVAIGAFVPGPLSPGVATGVRVFPGTVVVVIGEAVGGWVLLRAAMFPSRRSAPLAVALPVLLLASVVAVNLGALSRAPEGGLLCLLGRSGILAKTARPLSLTHSIELLALPVLLFPALAVGEGLGLRAALVFLGRAALRRPVPTLLVHAGLVVALATPLPELVQIGLAAVGVPVFFVPPLWAQALLDLGAVLPLALFFPLSLAAAHALRVTVDGPEKERG